MKKNIKIILIIGLVLLVILLGMKFVPFGLKNYQIKELSSSLQLPRLSFFKEETGEYVATFKTIKSKYILKKELDKIMDNFEERICHYDTYYYDEKNDVTIEKYEINSGILFNEFSISYGKGKYSNDVCNVITDPMRIEYDYFHVKEEREIKPLYKYLNKDGKLYDVYTTCDYCLSIKKGMGYFSYFEDLLKSSYMSMDDLITFLEYQVEIGDATKSVFYDGGSVIYKNTDFSFVKCNTSEGNKDVYFSDKLDLSIDYCKTSEE